VWIKRQYGGGRRGTAGQRPATDPQHAAAGLRRQQPVQGLQGDYFRFMPGNVTLLSE